MTVGERLSTKRRDETTTTLFGLGVVHVLFVFIFVLTVVPAAVFVVVRHVDVVDVVVVVGVVSSGRCLFFNFEPNYF